MRDIRRILVANRGEIALRVMRTARQMGIETVAVYSDADSDAPHTRFADDAVRIGPPQVGESYLNIEAILQAAARSGADSVHPGYGFLSENAAFAAALDKAGLIFIGPSAKAIEQMGDKARAKKLMQKAGVPCIPGYEGENQSAKTLLAEGKKIGWPLMVKAAAGGGGRGMRLVQGGEDLPDAIATARSEAKNAFGDGTLILEKALLDARHVEIQLLADSHDNVIHLGERDCSVQRRHQKIIEESPCPVVDDKLRQAMGEAAVEAARSIDYLGAGTVEFLLDSGGEFYFLEMNTRLQVEHPVTEMVTGLDLVEQQIRIARGEKLSLAQDEVRLDGHAIEVRLYAEDPEKGFLPSTGEVVLWREAEAEGLRYDCGIVTGQAVTPFYDPMLAKVIAAGPSRDIARQRLSEGLKHTALFGPRNNRDFLIQCLQSPRFVRGDAKTDFIEDVFGDGIAPSEPPPEPTPVQWAALAALFFHFEREAAMGQSLPIPRELENFTTAPTLSTPYRLDTGTAAAEVRVVGLSPQRCEVSKVEESGDALPGVQVRCQPLCEHRFALEVGGQRLQVLCAMAAGRLYACMDERSIVCDNVLAVGLAAEETAGSGRIVSPMHGRLLELFVGEGEQVAQGQRLAVLEAMKMQHDINADIAGTVTEIAAKPGQQLTADDLLLVIKPAD